MMLAARCADVLVRQVARVVADFSVPKKQKDQD
jgi:hypothetical protein